MKELRFIWQYLRPHWMLAALAPLCVLLEVWAELEQPELMSRIVDQGILGMDPEIVRPTGVRMVAYMLIGVVGGILSIYAAGKVAYSFGADMRRDIYSRISRFSFADVDRLEAPSLITRMGDDVNRVQQVVQASMRLLFRAPFLFVGSVVMAMLIDVQVSVVLLFIMLASFMFVIFIMRQSFPLFLNQQKRRDGFVGIVQEILVGVRVTKAYTNEAVEQAKFCEANEALQTSTIRVGKLMAVMMPVVSFALNMGVIIVIYLGSGEVSCGMMKVGGIMATINYLAQIQMALMMASHVIMSITQAQASIERLREVTDTPTEEETDAQIRRERPACQYANGDLELHDVSFSYDGEGGQMQIANISLRLPQGKTLAILGETGSGKSTLINLVPRFYDPTAGRITLGGQDLRDIDRHQLQSHVSVVMQHALLFSGSIAQNLRMGCPTATDEELMSACETVQMAEHIRQLPEGLEHMLDQGATNLSGGQKQRLSIARAILTKPDVLILDDSLCALDLLTESKVKAALDKIECTKIIVAQRISSIRNADIIVMLKAGHMEACGSHDELMAKSATYRETYMAQAGTR